MFYTYLEKAKVYFEYGSGGSTYQASRKDTIQKLYSVESDTDWQTKLKQTIEHSNIQYIFNEMDVKPNTWGYPGDEASDIQKINYSNHIRYLSKAQQKEIDLVLIDGRFRVACCLKCFDHIRPDCYIVFDDFIPRKSYHIVLRYYDIVDSTSDHTMVVLRKKQNIPSPSTELITRYELVPF